MKKTVLTAVPLLLMGAALNAQLSFLPQIGFEQARTTLNYASLASSSAAGNLKAALKMDYRFKGGHSPFINLTTTPAPVSFVFNNAGELIDRFQSSTPKLRLEAGYQYSSKAIQLGSGSAARAGTARVSAEPSWQRSACGSMCRSRCGQAKARNAAFQNQPWNLRLQPALALAYVPSAATGLVSDANGFEYKTAAWKTAVVPSMGFEFARGQQRLFTLSVFYTKPLESAKAMGTVGSGVKAVSLPLQSQTTTWGMTLGIPIGFAKAARPAVKAARGGCQRNRYRKCGWAQ